LLFNQLAVGWIYLAYFLVHSLAVLLNAVLFSLNCWAISGSRGLSARLGPDRGELNVECEQNGESKEGRFTRVGLHKNLPDGHQNLWDLELWAPAVVEHLVTQLAIALDVGMVDLRQKLDLRVDEERNGRERISRVADQKKCMPRGKTTPVPLVP
jgi:hypothetical protein